MIDTNVIGILCIFIALGGLAVTLYSQYEARKQVFYKDILRRQELQSYMTDKLIAEQAFLTNRVPKTPEWVQPPQDGEGSDKDLDDKEVETSYD